LEGGHAAVWAEGDQGKHGRKNEGVWTRGKKVPKNRGGGSDFSQMGDYWSWLGKKGLRRTKIGGRSSSALKRALTFAKQRYWKVV